VGTGRSRRNSPPRNPDWREEDVGGGAVVVVGVLYRRILVAAFGWVDVVGLVVAQHFLTDGTNSPGSMPNQMARARRRLRPARLSNRRPLAVMNCSRGCHLLLQNN
jgi:hypothetical protein